MTLWVRTKFVLGLFLLLMTLPLVAQTSAVRGALGGAVYDATGSAVAGLTVTVVGPQGSYTTTTDASGRYSVGGLVPGAYTVSIEAAGFKKFISRQNQVVVDHTATLDVHLEVGAVTDTVQVDAGAVQIDTQSTSLNTPLTDQLYETLPLPRNVSAIFSLAPGVVSGGGTGTSNPSIGGASGLENLYMVDGVTITDQAFGGLGTYNRYWGSLGSGVNLAFIKEVDVKTAGFESKYGRADGGIVEIVTKSGTTSYHGALAAYFGPGAWYADRYRLSNFNYVNSAPSSTLSNPQYDVAGEFGGYVPHFKDKLFFFGAFDPSLTQTISLAAPSVALYSHGPYAYSTTSLNWAAKLTYQFLPNMQLEASTFGDPSKHNEVPNSLAAVNGDSVGVRYNYGSRDSVARLSAAITPTWTVLAAYTYNYNKFESEPKLNNYQIQDRTTSPYITYGVGGYEPTKNNDYSINIETEKRFKFLGDHSVGVGYQYDHTNFLDLPSRTGPLYAIPGQNAAGADLSSLFTSFKSSAVGQNTNATFRLLPALNADGTPSTTCTYCANYNNQQVYLQLYRGTYQGLNVLATSRYHVGWVNDSYQMNRYVNIDAGLRWEEQWYAGTLMKYLFNDNWSPRVGVNVDPFGNQKSKIFFNYARYQSVLPLDAAIRQLGNEQDDTKFDFAPQTDGSGNALLDSTGAVIPMLDSTHVLNGTASSSSTTFGAPNFSSSTGEGILPGTKMEYENEYVLGFQREIVPGSVLSVRYSDRRLGRVVEDIGSQSPEGALVDGNYAGGIANVTATTDISENENEVLYTPSDWLAANSGSTPGSVTKANYVAPAAGCTYANDTAVANGDFFRKYDGTAYAQGACVTNAATAGSYGADGKPDGFANPRRHYQSLEVEYNRNLKNNWVLRANYRFAKLWGNYEGFFRNDNGQSDPGISSLFDFTNGEIGLLGDQTKQGYLNTDRRHVGNLNMAYTVSKDTRYVSALNKLTAGASLRGASGNPLSAYESHPIYGNTGEVPVGGRGTKGTLPTTLQLDLHADYPLQLKEKYTFKFAFDAFNVTNSQFQTGTNQNLDTAPGTANVDYGKPTGFQGPFYARASVKLEF